MIEQVDVAVIGGGITGLAAAWGAERNGASAVVLECGAECGGVIKSETSNGFLVERAATSMAGSSGVMPLLHQLGLGDDIIEPPTVSKRRYIVRDGNLCVLPSSPLGLLATPALSFVGKLRALMEPFVAQSTQPSESESLQQLVERRFGREVLDFVVDPFVSGVYAGDPARLSSRFALAMLSEMEQTHGSVVLGAIKSARAKAAKQRQTSGRKEKHPHILSFRRGMQQLPIALEAALQKPVRTHARVSGVNRDGEGWLLTFSRDGERRQLRANAIVVAGAGHHAGGIEWPANFGPALRSVREIRHAPVATVALGFRKSDVSHALDGFGALIPHVEQRQILGVLFSSSMFAGRAPDGAVLVTAFVGGARFTGELSGALAVASARTEVASLLGIGAPPLFERHHVWPQGIPQYNLGHEAIEASLARLESENRGLIFAGSYRTGVAVGQCLEMGVDAGRRAAEARGTSRPEEYNFLTAEAPFPTDETSGACVDPFATHFSGLHSRRTK